MDHQLVPAINDARVIVLRLLRITNALDATFSTAGSLSLPAYLRANNHDVHGRYPARVAGIWPAASERGALFVFKY